MAWVANVQISHIDGFTHVIGRTDGDTETDALAGAEYILGSIATGRRTFIRAKPSATTDRCFDTKRTFHQGFVRFSVLDEPGDWEYTSEIEPLPLGAA